ncbi:hypothetical protein GCM10020331_090070 [Ectobacillus funiculus]
MKLPMSILNTLVYRGLPSERTVIAPEVTAFMKKTSGNMIRFFKRRMPPWPAGRGCDHER